MPKYPSIAALSVAMLLLTGCGAASQDPGAGESESPSSAAESSPAETETETETETTTAPQEEQSSTPAEPTESATTEPEASSEPAPASSEPEVETSEPAMSQPDQQIITPVPTHDEVQRVATAGSTFIVTGEGYEPNDQIRVSLGIAQSDGMIVTVLLQADGTGKYSAPIALNSDLEPGSYAVMTVPEPQRGEALQEDAKRFASIEVVAP